MLLLDTNIVSYWMRGDQLIIDRIKCYRPCDLSISTITLAEIHYGIEKSPVKKKERREKIDQIKIHLEIYAFDEESAYQYASVRSYLEKKGIPISERDLQIASIALANQFDVVTHNTKEFQRIPQLTVHDWKE
ncbi:MAG: type II toxin-antitoxin system VapC family toxin [Deltaproteobacteria bacterium]|jgi:tRNA(fMet)-specific endonuclease VapC|nr:type II toxin-antitoxin system VapC family toxin [Deltaproteobacteria bacterium]